jgi:hypothetical protein
MNKIQQSLSREAGEGWCGQGVLGVRNTPTPTLPRFAGEGA